MTTAMVFVQRCMIIFAIVLCYFHVLSENVDCELYPFHHTCRGTMSRKRAMFPTVYGSECDENKGNLNCIKEFEERHRISYAPLSKSKLLIALLDDNLSKDGTHNARHKLRNNEMHERKPALMENFLSDLDSPDYY